MCAPEVEVSEENLRERRKRKRERESCEGEFLSV